MISIPPAAARRSARGIIAMVVTAAMTAATIGTVPPAAAQPPPFDWAALVPTADSLRQVQADLPDDEISATEHLVDTVWGADSLAAVSATGEILRRTGLPLVSADGPVVALPDGNVILNAPVLVEFLPTLTNAARSGTMYRPDQVAELLQFVGFAAEVPTGRDVVGLLAAWGKAHDDIPEVRAAGTAIRALARIRGQLLIPATMPTPAQLQLVTEDPGAIPGNVIDVITGPTAVAGIDPISTVLLLAHAAGELAAGVAVEPAGSKLRSPAAGAFRSDGGTVDCDALIDESDSRAGKEYEGAGKEFAKGQTRGALGDAAEHYGGETASKWTNLGGEAYDKLTDVISVVLLLLGAELTLEPDRKQTHFRHAPGERQGDVTVKATAKFSSALAKRHLRCWSLIGIDVPPDGPLKGYTVKWSMSKTPEAFQAFSDSSDKFLHGDVTDGSGVSSVSVYPRTELEPPKSGESQPELTIAAKIYASLDKDDFPWKLSDLLSMATAGGLGAAAVQALYNLLMSLVKRGALPTKVSTIQVKYHGQMPFVMQGEMNATAAFVQVSVDFRADLYSCTGPLGPWQGTVGSGGDVAIRHTGSAPEVVGSGQGDFPMSFDLADTGQPQTFHVSDGVGIKIELDPDAVKRVLDPKVVRDMYDAMTGKPIVVGSGTWTLEGQDAAKKLGAAMKWAPGTERFDVVGYKSDDRCGGSSYWSGHKFDRTERG